MLVDSHHGPSKMCYDEKRCCDASPIFRQYRYKYIATTQAMSMVEVNNSRVWQLTFTHELSHANKGKGPTFEAQEKS